MATREVILTATDFSPAGNAAVAYAGWLARARNAKLYILHVFHQPILFGHYLTDLEVPGGIDPAEMAEVGDVLAKRTNEMAAALRADGVDAEARIVEGRPSLEIGRAAEALGATLIVMGTLGRGRLGQFFLGSTVANVIRRAPCPVLSAPAAVLENPKVSERDLTTTRILVGTDFSRAADAALQVALEMATGTNARIDLVHVIDKPSLTVAADPLLGAHPAVLRSVLEMTDKMQHRLDGDVWEIREHGLAGDGHLLEGDPAEEIVRFAGENDIDLIVLGSVGRGAWSGMLLGSVADAVLRSAPVPVVTCGPHQPDAARRRGHHVVVQVPGTKAAGAS